MKRLHAWLIATALWFQLERLKDAGGWVVMKEDDEYGDWHVMGHGTQFGMDGTGRFENREQARAFRQYWARGDWATTGQGYDATYYVTHESLLSRKLPDYY